MRAKILLADDDPNILKLVEFHLLRDGYDILKAASTEEAISLARRDKPDLVISDIIMPEIGGYAMLEEFKKDDNLAAIPFFFLSSESRTEDKLKGFQLGADDYITKPFVPEELRLRVKVRLMAHLRLEDKNKSSISGKLNSMNIFEVLQGLNKNHKSGKVIVQYAGITGMIYFRLGQMISASHINRKGEAALFEILSLKSGEFSFIEQDVTHVEQNLHEDFNVTLFDQARILDEYGQIAIALPPAETPVAFADAEEAKKVLASTNPIEIAIYVAALKKQTVGWLLENASVARTELANKMVDFIINGTLNAAMTPMPVSEAVVSAVKEPDAKETIQDELKTLRDKLQIKFSAGGVTRPIRLAAFGQTRSIVKLYFDVLDDLLRPAKNAEASPVKLDLEFKKYDLGKNVVLNFYIAIGGEREMRNFLPFFRTSKVNFLITQNTTETKVALALVKKAFAPVADTILKVELSELATEKILDKEKTLKSIINILQSLVDA
jgi:CheY-like chemotaxis protein